MTKKYIPDAYQAQVLNQMHGGDVLFSEPDYG